MSKYNNYARKLDAAFRAARNEYNAAFEKLQQAQQYEAAAKAWKPDDSAEEKAVRVARAALTLHDAEAAFNEVSARVWNSFNITRRTIRAELEQELATEEIANPDAIDSNALELMKTGVLTAADYAAFVEKYDNNPTMLKLIAHYAGEAAKATDDRREAATLNGGAIACRSGQGAVMRSWDELSAIADRCSGQSRAGMRSDAGYVVNMTAHWEDVAGATIAAF